MDRRRRRGQCLDAGGLLPTVSANRERRGWRSSRILFRPATAVAGTNGGDQISGRRPGWPPAFRSTPDLISLSSRFSSAASVAVFSARMAHRAPRCGFSGHQYASGGSAHDPHWQPEITLPLITVRSRSWLVWPITSSAWAWTSSLPTRLTIAFRRNLPFLKRGDGCDGILDDSVTLDWSSRLTAAARRCPAPSAKMSRRFSGRMVFTADLLSLSEPDMISVDGCRTYLVELFGVTDILEE